MCKKIKSSLVYFLILTIFSISLTINAKAGKNDNFANDSIEKISINRQQAINTYIVSSNQIPVDLNKNKEVLAHDSKGICPEKHDHPHFSKKKNYNHMDEDCCPDPDEWPNPGCAYSASGLFLMLKGPTLGHLEH